MAKQKAKEADIEDFEPYERELECDLTDAEVAELKDRLVDVCIELEQAQDEKKLEMERHNGAINGLKDDQRALVKSIRTGQEKRKVQIVERWNWKLGVVQEVRTDTNQVMDERPMTAEERQERIDFGDGDSNSVRLKPGQKPENGEFTSPII